MWINVYQKIVSQTLNSSKNKLNVREGSSWDEYAQESRLHPYIQASFLCIFIP